jgi:DNA invertase Pin-like site-specific DNA recombinase
MNHVHRRTRRMVYKVDRLTRSLADFAKLVEQLAALAFVSPRIIAAILTK